MNKDREGEDLIPDVEPRRQMPETPDTDPSPDRELEIEENSNEKYRDRKEQKD